MPTISLWLLKACALPFALAHEADDSRSFLGFSSTPSRAVVSAADGASRLRACDLIEGQWTSRTWTTSPCLYLQHCHGPVHLPLSLPRNPCPDQAVAIIDPYKACCISRSMMRGAISDQSGFYTSQSVIAQPRAPARYSGYDSWG